MKIVKLPGTDTAVNTRYVTAIIDRPSPVDYYKNPLPPYVSVRFSLGVQQGDVSVYGMTLDEVVALLNQGETA
jgi:hypothetical protein